jgi:hypothetical protein
MNTIIEFISLSGLEAMKFIFKNFWTFIGFLLILFLMGNFIYNIYNRTLRHKILMKKGYPPLCDAEGKHIDGQYIDPDSGKILDVKLNFEDKMKKQIN